MVIVFIISIQGTQTGSRKKKTVLIFFMSANSIEGTPLFKGNGHFFRIPKPGFNLHSGDTLGLKTRLTTKRVDKFE